MKPYYIYLALLLAMATVQSCDPEPDCDKVITHNLKDLEQYISNSGNDTLRFLHNNLDTQTFIGQGLERYYVRCCKNADGDCFDDHESVRINYKHTESNDEINLDFPFFKQRWPIIMYFHIKTLNQLVDFNLHQFQY